METADRYRTISLRPGKAMSVSAVIIMIFLLLFGAGFAAIVGNVLFENEAPIGVTILFFIFMIGWMAAALSILIYHFLNLKRSTGVPMIEGEVATEFPEGTTAQQPAGRLRSREEPRR